MDVTDFLLSRLAEEESALDEAAGGPTDTGAGAARRRRAELRAMRGIVQLHQGAADIWGFYGCLTCGNVADTTAGYPCPTIRELAAVYADDPGYDEEWRPRRPGSSST